MDSIETSIKNIRGELKNYLIGNKIKSLVIGVSGGIDSCLCVALARPVCQELNIPLIGRSLPISTNAPDELERAQLTGKVFCDDFKEVNLANYYDKLSDINFLTNIDEQYLKGVSEGIQISVKLLKDCCNEMEQEYIVKLPI